MGRLGLIKGMSKTLAEYMQLPYRLEIVPDQADGGYAARFPELEGCLTCADTLEETLVQEEDAKRAWLMAALEDGLPIPEPQKRDK